MVSNIGEDFGKIYQPHLNRSHPFKWIYFPIFLGIWFTLYWFIICPIIWTKTFHWVKSYPNSWPDIWPYYFWSAALLIFTVILTILLVTWKCAGKKSEGFYNTIFLNPQFEDEKEKLCRDCTNFHPPRTNCYPITLKTLSCSKCGNPKESFDSCCRNKPDKPLPSFNIVLQKQQPKDDILFRNNDELDSKENKRNSLKSIKLRSSSTSSTVLISSHDIGTKNLITKPQRRDLASYHTETEVDHILKNKKSPKLKPINVDLANKYNDDQSCNIQKHNINDVNETPANNCEHDDKNSPENYNSESSFSTMKKFNEFLHLVEINTPFSPEEETIKTPLSPREIFFYDLIQAAGQSDNASSPDSLHFGGYKKERPTSHILLSSEVNYDDEADKEKLEKLSTNTADKKSDEKLVHVDSNFKIISSEHPSSPDQVPIVEEKNVIVKIVRTISKTDV